MNVRSLAKKRSAAFFTAMFAIASSVAHVACGGKTPEAKDATAASDAPTPIDRDNLALLPASPLMIVNLDARAFYDSASYGAKLASLTERLLPIGEESGFKASRDVDRVALGSYSTQGLDVAAVLRGRFDRTKIEQTAKSGVATKAGAPIVQSQYAGRALYTVNNVGFVVLTDTCVVVGTEAAIHRALDRIQDGRAKRDLAPWIVETVETPGAELAIAVDLANQPIAATAVGALPLKWIEGLKAARIIGNFQPPGMNVAGSLTYGDPNQARAAMSGLKGVAQIVNMVAITGVAPKVSNLKSDVAQSDVHYQFALDDESLRAFLTNAPTALGM
jgi:hypothetical protein